MFESLIGTVGFSLRGSSEITKERSTYMMFLNYIHDLEGIEHPVCTVIDSLTK